MAATRKTKPTTKKTRTKTKSASTRGSQKSWETKDSGQRQQFDTGAQRDTAEGKVPYNLIPPWPLKRIGGVYDRGARKYQPFNWAKGIPFTRVFDSAQRHLEQWKEQTMLGGEYDEDHLAQAAWNLFTLMTYEEFPEIYGDMNDFTQFTNEDNPRLRAQQEA